MKKVLLIISMQMLTTNAFATLLSAPPKPVGMSNQQYQRILTRLGLHAS